MSTIESLDVCNTCGGVATRYFDNKSLFLEITCHNVACISSLTTEEKEILVEHGYERKSEMELILGLMEIYYPPYNADLEDRIHWVEFCRALRDEDFGEGDCFWLNGYQFEVKG